jgi:hypothetical protein
MLQRRFENKQEKVQAKHEVAIKELSNGWRLSLQNNQQRLETQFHSINSKIDALTEHFKKVKGIK